MILLKKSFNRRVAEKTGEFTEKGPTKENFLNIFSAPSVSLR